MNRVFGRDMHPPLPVSMEVVASLEGTRLMPPSFLPDNAGSVNKQSYHNIVKALLFTARASGYT